VFTLLLVVVALFSWHMTERTLRPVERMRQSAEAITASDLSRRVSVPDGDRDLSRLARTFNDLLARVEAAMDAQRRFVSDASHELKGPVAATKVMLETARAHPEAVDPSTLLSDLANENEQLQGIVADLLALARQDEGRLQVNLVPLDLCDLIYEEVSSLERRSAVSLDVSGVEPLVCAGDAQLLGQALRNLLENAVRYAHSHVAVTCREVLGSTGRLIRISVSDDGPGIAPADRERVFGRFVRLGKDRGRATGGTGLGLAVVQGIVERHGGRVYFSDPEIGGATAVMELVGKAPARCE
jgi:signal transduction histidine kinase